MLSFTIVLNLLLLFYFLTNHFFEYPSDRGRDAEPFTSESIIQVRKRSSPQGRAFNPQVVFFSIFHVLSV